MCSVKGGVEVSGTWKTDLQKRNATGFESNKSNKKKEKTQLNGGRLLLQNTHWTLSTTR
jgi:hypothetical protein